MLLHGNDGYANAPQCYVIPTLRVLLSLSMFICKARQASSSGVPLYMLTLCVINTKTDGGTLWKSWLRLHSQTTKAANDTFLDVSRRFHQGVPYLQDITCIYGIAFVPVRNVQASLRRFSLNSQMISSFVCRYLVPNVQQSLCRPITGP